MVDSFSLFENVFEDTPQLRVLTNLKSSKKLSADAYVSARKINFILKKINFEYSRKNKGWKEEWLKKENLNIKKSGIKEWFSGRSSIPLVAISSLNKFVKQADFQLIKENCNYFCTKTSAPVYFPRVVSLDLAWFVAAVLCDGHLKNNHEGVTFEFSDIMLTKKVGCLFSTIFKTSLKKTHTINRRGYNQTYAIYLSSAPVALFLNKLFEIPFGYKCNIISLPELIKQSDLGIKKAFLKGVFDTDGGKRGKGLGLTSLSESFITGVSDLLKEFNINLHKESWINNRYGKKCFGLRFKIDTYSKFLMRQ